MARPKKINKKTIAKILQYFQDSCTIRECFKKPDIDITWQTFRSALIKSDDLMNQYLKSRQIAQDYKLDELTDKRKEIEEKILSGNLEPKQAQNYVNLLKVWTAHTQWLSSKIQPKKYGKTAELIHKGSAESPITISWAQN